MNNPSDQESGGWLESRGFGALDWASEKHSVVVVVPRVGAKRLALQQPEPPAQAIAQVPPTCR